MGMYGGGLTQSTMYLKFCCTKRNFYGNIGAAENTGRGDKDGDGDPPPPTTTQGVSGSLSLRGGVALRGVEGGADFNM